MKLQLLLLTLSVCLFSFNAQATRSPAVQQASFSNSISKASESVVSIYASRNIAKLEDNIDAAMSDKNFIDDFVNSLDPEIKVKEENTLGSGVIVDKTGLVITNTHIVDGALDIKVVTGDGQVYSANTVATDKSLDLAILQIQKDNANFNAIDFADSDSILVGDVVFALGNPFGIGQSASMGIISAIGRSNFNMEASEYLIQTDAAINPGNSGGALIDVDGNLVGLNSAIFSRTGAFSGVGFAVPSNALKFVIDTLKTEGEIQRAWFGAKGQDINPSLQKSLGLNSSNGVYINNIVKGSPAELAGIKVGDVLLKLNKPIKNSHALASITPTLPINHKVNATVYRAGRVVSLEVRLKPISKRVESDKFMIRGTNVLSGLVVENLSPELNSMLNLPLEKQGIAVVDRPKAVTSLNIQVGDIILQINNTVINTLNDLEMVLSEPAPYGWNFSLLRSGKKIKMFVK